MSQIISLKNHIQQLINHRTEPENAPPKITTGHVDLDKLIGGFRLPSINIVAGKPGHFAKETAFSLLYRIAADKIPSAMIYTSTNKFDMFYWHLASETKQPSNDFLLSNSIELQLKVLKRSHQKAQDIPLLFNTKKPFNFNDFLDQAQNMVNQGVKLIAVDSLIDLGQLSLSGSNENNWSKENVWSRLFELRDFADRNNIAFLIAHKVLEESHYEFAPEPRFEELVWANAVDNIADTIFLTYWPFGAGMEYDSIGDLIAQNEIELNLVKNDYGRIGELKLEVRYEPTRLV